MPLSDVDLCSAALVKLGAKPIASLQDGSVEAEVSARLYPTIRDSLLGTFPWTFTIAHQDLVRDATAPLGDFAFAFTLPDDLVRTVSAGPGPGGSGLVYRVYGKRLHCSSPSVRLTYQRRAPEADFPPHFVSALVARLAAELCLPLTEDTGRGELLFRLAASELQLAKSVDSQQGTPLQVNDWSLIEARVR